LFVFEVCRNGQAAEKGCSGGKMNPKRLITSPLWRKPEFKDYYEAFDFKVK